MTADKCIIGKAEAGDVDKAATNKLVAKFRERAKEVAEARGISEEEASRLIGGRIQEEAVRELQRKKKMAKRQLQVQTDLRNAAKIATDEGWGVDKAMMGRLSFAASDKYKGPSLDKRIEGIQGIAHAEMASVLSEFRPRASGLTQKLGNLDDTIREMFGQKTGNEAAANLGKALNATVEKVRTRYNAAGGDIAKREDWGFFQTHDAARIAAVPKDEWKQFVFDRLNMSKMLDVNGLPMTPGQVWKSLDPLYDSIATRGLVDMADNAPGPRLFSSNVNTRANSRFLTFEGPDKWMEYQRAFGKGSMYDHIITSIDTLARDTAILEILGPHPDATLRFMDRLIDEGAAANAISKTGKLAERAAGKIGSPKFQLKALFNTVTGRAGIADSGPISDVSQAVRNVMTSAHLGSAFIMSLGDFFTLGLTGRMNGISPFKIWNRAAKVFLPGNRADRELAIRLGFTAQGWASRAIAAQRVLGEVTGPEFTERMTDVVLRASWLSPLTEANRYGFQMEFLGLVTSNANRSFDRLQGALRNSFNRHGITEADWELIRSTEKFVDPESGAAFIRSEDVARGSFEGPSFEAANKLQQAIAIEKEHAVPSTNARIRALLTGGIPANTLIGEILRNTAMFKAFPLAIHNLHMVRFMSKANPITKAEYAAWMLIGLTSMGAIGEQLNSIARGKDPETPDNLDFWSRAMMRGGSLGLFGDIVFQDQNRFGGGVTDLLAGPVFSLLDDTAQLTIGNVQQLIAGDDTNFGRELSRFVEQNTPGRSLWYARLALERTVFDQLDKALDPKSGEQFRKIERKARQDRNQRYWSRPGGGPTPQRAPQLTGN